MKNYFIVFCLLMSTVINSYAVSWPIQGEGTQTSPYLISSENDLKALADSVNIGKFIFTGKYFKMTNDIALSTDTVGKPGWVTIGLDNGATTFNGTFDGDGHKITNLFVNRTSSAGLTEGLSIGLFSHINTNGTVENLTIEDCNITGYRFIGGISGSNNGTIENCKVTGKLRGRIYVALAGQRVGGITGENSGNIDNCHTDIQIPEVSSHYIGGIAGQNIAAAGKGISNCSAKVDITVLFSYVGGITGNNGANATISDCYSTGTVKGLNYIGGVVGYNQNNLTKCYSTTGVVGVDYVGGLSGNSSNTNSKITSCVAINDSVKGSTNMARLVGKKGGATSLDNNYALETIPVTKAGAPYTLVAAVADGVDGLSKTLAELQTKSTYDPDLTWDFTAIWGIRAGIFGGFPYLQTQVNFPFAGGSGTTEDPYLIANAVQLDSVRHYLSNKFILVGDIDLSAYQTGWGWQPIGKNDERFIGSLNGKGYSITNLVVNGNSDEEGLFGCLGAGALIDSVNIVDCNVKGKFAVGGIAGKNDSGKIFNCSVTGGIESTDSHVGGLIGINMAGQVKNCHANCNVTGAKYVGGLIGDNFSATVTDSYSLGTVTASSDNAGGLSGANDGTITGSYSACDINSTGNNVGGLVGLNEGSFSYCYATGSVKGKNNVGGLVGGNEGPVSKCYSIGSVTATNQYAGGLVGNSTLASSNINNCVAANASVSGSANVARIVGFKRGTLSTNFALNTISVNGVYPASAIAANDINGSNIDLKGILSTAFYTDSLQSWDMATKWSICDGLSMPVFIWQPTICTTVESPLSIQTASKSFTLVRDCKTFDESKLTVSHQLKNAGILDITFVENTLQYTVSPLVTLGRDTLIISLSLGNKLIIPVAVSANSSLHTLQGGNGVEVYPNPIVSGKDMTINFGSVEQENAGITVDLYTIAGAKITSYSQNGGNQVNIPVVVAPGNYILKIKTGNATTIKKLVVQ